MTLGHEVCLYSLILVTLGHEVSLYGLILVTLGHEVSLIKQSYFGNARS